MRRRLASVHRSPLSTWLLALCCVAWTGLPAAHAQPAQPSPGSGGAWQAPPPDWQSQPYIPPPMAPSAAGAVPYDARQVAIRYELLQVEEQLAQLRASRPRIFWPVAIVAVGGSVALAHGVMGLVLWGTSRQQRYGWDEEGNRYEYTYVDPDDRAAARESAVGFAIGAAIAAGGLLLLVPRVKKRQALRAQSRDLLDRRLQLIRAASYSFNLDHSRGGLSATFRF